ncbi:alpha-isopropylmalate synthase regulatory domain-containing protein [Candidatus Albibeggiatoa sp. nov. BB20]|uniref:alpha-isopropylmalate synthase regulatory domain-containing protein n=1 Tax=Candidatus Albibeggiatoa sp. nov. BB20 TaxID=3162723 RepID=UPI00336568E0
MSTVPSLEIMDTTLRDGEQMQNVSYTTEEKLTLSKILLTEVKVDRLEITSARVSEGEKKTVKKILDWAQDAGFVDKFEILSFIDGDRSVQWAKSVGIQRLNLLTKGSYKHCSEQLRKTPEQHIEDIRATINSIAENGLQTNVYLEDFSNGIKDSPQYIFDLIEALNELPVQRILLPDTLGIFNPFETYEYISQVIQRYPQTHFEFHPHNDYGVGTANALAAARAGIKGIHTTVNGMGERAGNAPLDEVVIAIRDFLNIKVNVDETKLHKVSQYVEMFSGQRMAHNKPIYGKNVFTQTAGIHADGDKKGQLYSNPLKPERFNRKTKYALGKLSGKANLDMCLRELDIEISEEEKQVLLKKIIELGDKKEIITTEDLPYLILDVFEMPEDRPFKLLYCSINSTYQLKPVAAIKCAHHDRVVEAYSHGNGGYDAFMNALQEVLFEFNIPMPQLLDYSVTIPPGGQTNALVQAAISWQIKKNGKPLTVTTRGVDPDQNMAAIEATVKMINTIVSHAL